MSRFLGEHLIAAKKITEDQLEKVLERQVTEGGRLGTNLIELGYLTEEELTHFLSEKFQIPIVPQVVLAQIPKEVIQLVPKGLAIQYEMIPFGRQGNILRIAVADPTNTPEIATLPIFQPYELQFHVASEIRIQYFLKKYYQADAKMRFLSILHREQDQSKNGSRVDRSNEDVDPSKIELYMELAKKDLLLIQDQDEIIRSLIRYLSFFLERVYCFSVKKGKLNLWMSIPEEEGHDLSLPTDDLPLFKQVIKNKTFYDGPMISSGMEKLIEALDIQVPPQVVVIPMLIQGHVVCVIYGDNFFSRRMIPHIPAIKSLVAKTAMALEIIILRKKIIDG
ncbi:MAG: hypothetical protein MPW17_03940 [Candidatus Manganitrophus sp.]|nr:hypothetical protein [Candidatus Manganitrophus sp.]WDT72006.1 MAG: hypothetical protein MPW17_03940 [Candidatus Manganitrophus sp.]